MSEPKVVLLGGSKGNWSAKERIEEAATATGIEGWLFALDADYREGISTSAADLESYDIIIGNVTFAHTDHFLRLAQSRKKQSKWVTLIEGDALLYVKPQPNIRELFDSSDLVLCINKYSEDFFQRFTSAPVAFLGIPYPAEGIRKHSTPIADRRKDVFLATRMLTSWVEYYCVKDLGFPFYGYEKKLSRKWKNLYSNMFIKKSFDRDYFHKMTSQLYSDPGLTLRREESLPHFFRHNGAAHLWINLDSRYTWGRYVLDAAALEVPIISTRSTGHAETFFPELVIENEFDLDKAGELINRLFNDKEFYRTAATIPLERFDHLRPEAKKKELLDILYP